MHQISKSQVDFDYIMDNLTMSDVTKRLQFMKYYNWCNDPDNHKK